MIAIIFASNLILATPQSVTAPTESTTTSLPSTPALVPDEACPPLVTGPIEKQSESKQSKWGLLVGFQNSNHGLGGVIGFERGNHELRMVGFNGLSLEYRKFLYRKSPIHLSIGTAIGTEDYGVRIGIQHRRKGHQRWGRLAAGLDAGLSCNYHGECYPAGGLSVIGYFDPEDY